MVTNFSGEGNIFASPEKVSYLSIRKRSSLFLIVQASNIKDNYSVKMSALARPVINAII